MADVLSYRPSSSAVYYTPQSKVHWSRMFAWLAVAIAGAIVGGAFYAWCEIRLDGLYFRLGAVAVAAGATALLAILPIRKGRVQRSVVAGFVGVAVAAVALYAMWVAWMAIILNRMGFSAGFAVPTWKLVTHPIGLFKLIRDLSGVGTWTWKGTRITGVSLVIIWFLEGAAIMACGVMAAIKSVQDDDPICRECGTRCKRSKPLPRFAADRQDELLAIIESKDFANLLTHPAPANIDAPELSLVLMSCPACAKMHVLTVNRIAWDIVNGQPKVVTRPILNRLLITAEEAVTLKEICGQVGVARDKAGSEPAKSDAEATQ